MYMLPNKKLIMTRLRNSLKHIFGNATLKSSGKNVSNVQSNSITNRPTVINLHFVENSI